MTTAFHHNLKIVDTKNGKGVITTVDIPPNTVIFEFNGDIFNRDNLPSDNPYYLQIGPNKYLGPSGDYDDYINHSCNPNCGLIIVGSRAFLKSLYFIPHGTEITFDYSTSSTESYDEWTMKCNCGYYNCRKNISGYHSLPEDIKNKYEKLKIVPYYLAGK
jgi:SET domain-containing protein